MRRLETLETVIEGKLFMYIGHVQLVNTSIDPFRRLLHQSIKHQKIDD